MKVKPFFPPPFSLSSFTFIKRLFSSSLISATRVVSFEIISHFQRTNLFNRKVSSALDSLLPTCPGLQKVFLGAEEWDLVGRGSGANHSPSAFVLLPCSLSIPSVCYGVEEHGDCWDLLCPDHILEHETFEKNGEKEKAMRTLLLVMPFVCPSW